MIDSESAYELLAKRAQKAATDAQAAEGGGGILDMLGGLFGTSGARKGTMTVTQRVTREVTRTVVNQTVGSLAAQLGKSLGGRQGSSIGRAIVRGTLGGSAAAVAPALLPLAGRSWRWGWIDWATSLLVLIAEIYNSLQHSDFSTPTLGPSPQGGGKKRRLDIACDRVCIEATCAPPFSSGTALTCPSSTKSSPASMPISIHRSNVSSAGSRSRRSPPIRPTRTIAARRGSGWWTSSRASASTPALRETGGHPAVVGHVKGEAKPHVLFYGHYDVQPVDPLDLWQTPPFEPKMATLPDGRKVISARGSSDDKGQVLTFVEACRAWKAVTGSLPINITFLVEGAEEDGSKFLPEFVEANKDELKADVALVCDTGMWDQNTPAITSSLRGMVYEEVIVRCADRDLHSGQFGGAARNPIHVLAKIIAAVHDENGRITIKDFYEGVPETPTQMLEQWKKLNLTEEEFLGQVGLKHSAGEKDRMLIEQIQSRPTCDVNGIIGGYTGEGTKTVIAAEARCKISFRLVGDQDPAAISRNFHAFVEERIPSDCAWSSSVTRVRARRCCRTTSRRSPPPRARCMTNGRPSRSSSEWAARFRSAAISSARSGSTHCSSASGSTMTAFTHRTRNTTSRAFKRARVHGRASWRLWRSRTGSEQSVEGCHGDRGRKIRVFVR